MVKKAGLSGKKENSTTSNKEGPQTGYHGEGCWVAGRLSSALRDSRDSVLTSVLFGISRYLWRLQGIRLEDPFWFMLPHLPTVSILQTTDPPDSN